MYKGKFIVDVHAHVWPNDLAQKAGDFLANYYGINMEAIGHHDALKESMAANGIDVVVACSVATAVKQVEKINDFLSGVADDNILIFGALHPDYHDIKAEVRRIKDKGFKGIKLHPDFQKFYLDDIKVMRMYEEIGDTLPILMHMGDENTDFSAPHRLAKVMDEMPYMRFIGAHMGGYLSWDEVERHLVGRELYMDTSNSLYYMPSSQAIRMIRNHGADRILFGTDFPSKSYAGELEKFDELDLTEEERTNILGENARLLLAL